MSIDLKVSFLPIHLTLMFQFILVWFLNFSSHRLQLFHWLSLICFPEGTFSSKAPHKSLSPILCLGRICSFLMIDAMVPFVLNPNDIKLAVSHCSNFYFYICPYFCKRYLLWTQLRFLFSLVRCIQHLKLNFLLLLEVFLVCLIFIILAFHQGEPDEFCRITVEFL